MIKTEYRMPSSTGKDMLHLIEWLPEEITTPSTQGARLDADTRKVPGAVKGIIQISHGMIECVERYDRFAGFMTKQGFAVIGNDHLGHGETAEPQKKFGYFAKHDGSRYVVRDLRRVSCYIRKKYPGVPLILVGHSMGSFMARRYAMCYGKELDALILMGTGKKPQGLLYLGQFLVEAFGALEGITTHNWVLEKLCFMLYNRHFEPTRTPFDWISRNPKEVDRYLANPYCQFTFTLNGYRTLFEVLSYIQKTKNIRKIPHTLPILCLAGTEDPVGNYGKGVRSVARDFSQEGVLDVKFHLYYGARHELLNEYGYGKVQRDILRWIQATIYDSPKNSSM